MGKWKLIDRKTIMHPVHWAIYDGYLERKGRTDWTRTMTAVNGCEFYEGLHVHEQLTAYDVSAGRMYVLDHCLDADVAVLFIYAPVSEG